MLNINNLNFAYKILLYRELIYPIFLYSNPLIYCNLLQKTATVVKWINSETI